MRKEFDIPQGVEVSVSGKTVSVKGPKGELTRIFPTVAIKKENSKLEIFCRGDRREARAMVGTVEAHIKNMAKGAAEGFEYKLKIVYAHFPMTAKFEGGEFIVDNFLGEKFPRRVKIQEGVEIKVNAPDIVVSGIDKEITGQTAAKIEQLTKLSMKDRRVFQDGIFIVEKAGAPV